MHACIHTYIHTHIHIHIHTYIHTYIHYTKLHYITLHYITLHYITYMHTYIYTLHTYPHTYIYIHAYMHTCIHAFMHPCHPHKLAVHSPPVRIPSPKSHWFPLVVLAGRLGPEFHDAASLVPQHAHRLRIRQRERCQLRPTGAWVAECPDGRRLIWLS